MKKLLITLTLILSSIFTFSQNYQGNPIITGCSISKVMFNYPDTHNIEFKGVIYDFPNSGKSTWLYKVTCSKVKKVKAISHTCFGVDLTCIDFEDFGTYENIGNVYDFYSGSGNPNIVNPDPKTGIIGVKFNDRFDNKVYEYYYFTINTNQLISTTSVGIKASKNIFIGNVCGPIDCCVPVPIELLNFNIKVENEVVIEWSTASEINNDYFSIEHSYDGENYTPLAYIKGAGNSNNYLNYHYILDLPNPGISYYRLKQTDFDGKFEYSKTISVQINSDIDRLVIYPNPIKKGENINIKFSESNFNILIYDMYGKLVYKNKNQLSILNNFKSGLYTIKIIKNNQILIKKIQIN